MTLLLPNSFIPLQCIQGENFLQNTMGRPTVFFEPRSISSLGNDEMQICRAGSTMLLEGNHGVAQILKHGTTLINLHRKMISCHHSQLFELQL